MRGVQRMHVMQTMQMRPVQVLAMEHVKVQSVQVGEVMKRVQMVLVMHVGR